MCLAQRTVEKISMAAQVHDIGKIGVSGSILNKPTRLTNEEFQNIQQHSVIGEHILKPMLDDQEILSLVRNHHEHSDGSGYPDHLERSQISVGSRIIAVADAFDAMPSDRAYRHGMTSETAFDELKRGIGSQFDSEVVSAMHCLVI